MIADTARCWRSLAEGVNNSSVAVLSAFRVSQQGFTPAWLSIWNGPEICVPYPSMLLHVLVLPWTIFPKKSLPGFLNGPVAPEAMHSAVKHQLTQPPPT